MKNILSIAIILGLANFAFAQNFGIDIASPSQKLDVNGHSRIRGDIYCDNNYGEGLVGVYSDTRYQNVWAMGTSWRLPANGTTPGNLYGLAWTHSNIGGQSKGGLSHQLLVMENGTTKVALGSGVWTNYTSYFPFSYDTDDNGYYTDPNSWSRHYGLGSFYLRNNYGVSTDHQYGMYWDNGLSTAYAIFREGGGWGHPYPDLRIAFHTGLKFGANYSYDGIAFYTDYDMSDLIFRINDQYYSGFHNTTTWGYAYAYGFYGISSRELKKDIQKFDNTDYESTLALVDDIELNYFRYKKADLVPGIHMGLIAEEAPIFITDGQKKGISAEKLGYVLTGAVRVLKKKVETLEQQIRNISDFGAEEISSNQLWVKFSEDFKTQLNGAQPIVTVTPAQPQTDMWVSRVSQEGFMVDMTTQSHAVVFNWIAMAKLRTKQENDPMISERFAAMIESVKTEKRATAPSPDPNLVKPVEPAPLDPKTFNNDLAVPPKATFPAPKPDQKVKE